MERMEEAEEADEAREVEGMLGSGFTTMREPVFPTKAAEATEAAEMLGLGLATLRTPELPFRVTCSMFLFSLKASMLGIRADAQSQGIEGVIVKEYTDMVL